MFVFRFKLTICLPLCRNLESVLSLLRFQNDQDADYYVKRIQQIMLSPTKPNYGHFHPNDYTKE